MRPHRQIEKERGGGYSRSMAQYFSFKILRIGDYGGPNADITAAKL
jgi:hypothetical protein